MLPTGEHHPTDYLAERIDKEDRIAKQLGTLGGGNHFLEVVYAEGDEQAGQPDTSKSQMPWAALVFGLGVDGGSSNRVNITETGANQQGDRLSNETGAKESSLDQNPEPLNSCNRNQGESCNSFHCMCAVAPLSLRKPHSPSHARAERVIPPKPKLLTSSMGLKPRSSCSSLLPEAFGFKAWGFGEKAFRVWGSI